MCNCDIMNCLSDVELQEIEGNNGSHGLHLEWLVGGVNEVQIHR